MSLTHSEFDYIRRLVLDKSAIVLEEDKEYLVESRLLPLARREGMASLGVLIRKLQSEPFHNLHQRAVEAMTTNETSFFRDLHPFETLRKTLLPQLINQRAAERELTIWCAACSSGQEPYSLAMLLRENFPQLANWKVRILATDLSSDILARAREGRYNQLEVNRGLPVALLVKYFQKRGSDWYLREEIRNMVTFQVVNLAGTWPFIPLLDIVMLRNVLIYFAVESKKEILAKVRRILKPDGYLFLGGSETTFGIDDAFERVQLDRTTCYRTRPT